MPGIAYNVDKHPRELKPHKLNIEIYGDEIADPDLIESIRERGILESLVIKTDGTIVSGHRRWLAAKALKLDKVPCRILTFDDELDEEESLIEFNRQREKNFSQRMKEAEHIKRIEAERALRRQAAGRPPTYINVTKVPPTLAELPKDLNTTPTTFSEKMKDAEHITRIEAERAKPRVSLKQIDGPEVQKLPPDEKPKVSGEATKIIAEKVGMKRETFKKAQRVWEAAKSGDETATKLKTDLDKGKITINRAYNQIRIAEKKEEIKEASKTPPKPTGKYDVIYCDPPWKYAFSETVTREVEKEYPTMTLEDIKAIKIPAEDDSVLLLWATAPKLEEAIQVLNAWGYSYRTCAVWDKEVIGMGYWFRGQHELLLVGVKGDFKAPTAESRYSSVVRERRTTHSKKPDVVYEMIENMFPGKKYLEMFARKKHNEKWCVWGNEV